MDNKHFYFGLSTICFVMCTIAIDSGLSMNYPIHFQGVFSDLFSMYSCLNDHYPIIFKMAIISFVVMVYFFWKIIRDKKRNHV